jgi:hypothetical protein
MAYLNWSALGEFDGLPLSFYAASLRQTVTD